MGKKKTETTQKNDYGYIPQPVNPYYQQVEDAANAIDSSSGVKMSYGRLRSQIMDDNSSAFGADVPQELRDKQRQSQLFRTTTDEGKSLYEAQQADNATKMNIRMGLGAATAPKFVQTGGTSTQVQPFDWGGLATGLVGGAAQVGSAVATGGASAAAARGAAY